MVNKNPDYAGLINALNSIGIDDLRNCGHGIIIIEPHEGVFEGFDDTGSCVIHQISGRRMHPWKFGFNIFEGDASGQDFVGFMPMRAS